jgi:hypothetical protein
MHYLSAIQERDKESYLIMPFQCGPPWNRMPRSVIISLIAMAGSSSSALVVATLLGLTVWNGGMAAASAFAVLGFLAGFCAARHFGRLVLHERNICVSGIVDFIQQSPQWYLSMFWDADLSFNIMVPQRYKYRISSNAEYATCAINPKNEHWDSDRAFMQCEIVSQIQTAACITGVIGAVVGAVLGTIAGVAIATGLLASLGCGVLFFICALFILLVSAVVSALIAAGTAYVAGLVGALIGKAIDENNDMMDIGCSLHVGDFISVRGDWIMDTDHGWNEIHPVSQLSLHGPRVDPAKRFTNTEADNYTDDCPIQGPG